MKRLKIFLSMLFLFVTANGFAEDTKLKSFKLEGHCKDLTVEIKNLNGVPSVAITESPSIAFSALAAAGLNTDHKKCLVDMMLLVPANAKVGVYDPKTNHLNLGRFNGIQYVTDNNSSFEWKVGWDLQDAAFIPMQTRSFVHVGPFLSNYFGGDFQAVAPDQWSACSQTPRLVNLKMLIELIAKSSRENSAELIFRNTYVRLTTQKCRYLPVPIPMPMPMPRTRF